MKECEFKVSDLGFTCGDTVYFRKTVAASMAGIHPDTLGRLYLQSGYSDEDRAGVKLGTLFFSETHLESLGLRIIKEVTV